MLHYLGSEQQKRNAKHVQAYQHLIKISNVFTKTKSGFDEHANQKLDTKIIFIILSFYNII